MNHDATHCADYSEKCPKSCYRAELTAELMKRRGELHYLPISWCHYLGTRECMYRRDKDGTT